MTGSRIITGDEFAEQLRSFRRRAFRLETRDRYAVDIERDAFRRFLDGNPMTPSEWGEWQAWLDDMRELTRQGKTISRVRILSDPPTDYQRFEMWGTPWHAEAGEQILYLPRERAQRIGLAAGDDWWLLDDERLIVIRFTDADEPASYTLTTDPALIAEHRKWRDLAIRHAVTAEHLAAA